MKTISALNVRTRDFLKSSSDKPVSTSGAAASEKAMEDLARRAAKRIGLKAVKTRCRVESMDNHLGFMLINEYGNVVDGERFNLSADDVLEHCAENVPDE